MSIIQFRVSLLTVGTEFDLVAKGTKSGIKPTVSLQKYTYCQHVTIAVVVNNQSKLSVPSDCDELTGTATLLLLIKSGMSTRLGSQKSRSGGGVVPPVSLSLVLTER